MKALRAVNPRPKENSAISAVALSADAIDDVLSEGDVSTGLAGRVDADTRHDMVATAAYYIAEQRGFEPGHELDDWATAERMIDASLLSAERQH